MTNEISGYNFFLLLRRKFKVLLFFSLASSLLSLPVSLLILPKTYQAETELLVQTKTNYLKDGMQANLNANLLSIKTFKDMIEGQMIQSKVRQELAINNIQLSKQTLQKQLRLVQKPDSQFFKIQAIGKTPKIAAQIANLAAKIFAKELKDNLDFNQVTIVSIATAPEQATSPNILLNLALATTAGFGLCLLLLLWQFTTNLIPKKGGG